jgi:hypothetical protein
MAPGRRLAPSDMVVRVVEIEAADPAPQGETTFTATRTDANGGT